VIYRKAKTTTDGPERAELTADILAVARSPGRPEGRVREVTADPCQRHLKTGSSIQAAAGCATNSNAWEYQAVRLSQSR
jgi:hypothetical protein